MIENFTHEILDCREMIAPEKETWNDIAERHYEGHPHRSHEWHMHWLDRFGSQVQGIHFARIRYGEEVAGYFPLISKADDYHGVAMNCLAFAGNIYSPVMGPLLRPEHREQASRYFAVHVIPQFPWTFFRADAQAEEDPGLNEMETAFQAAGYLTHRSPSFGNWIWNDPSTDAEAYFRHFKRNIREDLSRDPRRLAKLGRLEFKLLREVSTADIAAYRHVFARSWKRPEIDPLFYPSWMPEVPRGWLRLALLTLNDKPIATQFVLVNGPRAWLVRIAHDEEFRGYSPGTLVMWKTVETLLNEGVRYLDLMRGDGEYKKNWTNQRRQRYILQAFRPDLRGRACHWLEHQGLPWIRGSATLSAFKKKVRVALDD